MNDCSDNVGNRNRFNYAIRSFIHKGQYIENFDDRDLEEIIRSKNPPTAVGNKREFNQEAAHHVDSKTTPRKVDMVDLETSLSYMLRRDIPRVKEIQGEAYDALLHWLIVLNKVCIEQGSFGSRRIHSSEGCELIQWEKDNRLEALNVMLIGSCRLVFSWSATSDELFGSPTSEVEGAIDRFNWKSISSTR